MTNRDAKPAPDTSIHPLPSFEDPSRASYARHIGAVNVVAGLEPTQGGPAYSVPCLCEALAKAGARTTLMSVSPLGAKPAKAQGGQWQDLRFKWDHASIPILRTFRMSRELASALANIGPTTDVFHSHGLWLMPHLAAASAAERARKPHIIAPRGMLSPAALTFSKRKKQVYWHLLQKRCVRNAACLQATSEQEYEELRALGLTNPIAIVTNAIDLPELQDEQIAPKPGRTLLSIGRLHPKKGLDVLLRAWSSVQCQFPYWRLLIVGPDEDGYAAALSDIARQLRLQRVMIAPPAYGTEKLRLLNDADLFVLPTLNENFGLVVAEALASRIPVISTKGAPWSGLSANRCGWWIDHGTEPLSSALSDAMSRPTEELRRMGERGRKWMERDFSWDRIGREMLEIYEWVLHRGAIPSALRLN